MRTWRDGDGTLTVGTDPGAGAGGQAVPLRIAASYRARTRGLLGRDGIEGAMMLTPCGSVHTFRMRFPIDVAYLDRKFTAHHGPHGRRAGAQLGGYGGPAPSRVQAP
ncbi:DUF192 domain-containing protein [Streptomyces sp. MBT61]|nr:DUF192 domain-containing protein [Streptomyces sp. MBT61]